MPKGSAGQGSDFRDFDAGNFEFFIQPDQQFGNGQGIHAQVIGQTIARRQVFAQVEGLSEGLDDFFFLFVRYVRQVPDFLGFPGLDLWEVLSPKAVGNEVELFFSVLVVKVFQSSVDLQRAHVGLQRLVRQTEFDLHLSFGSEEDEILQEYPKPMQEGFFEIRRSAVGLSR